MTFQLGLNTRLLRTILLNNFRDTRYHAFLICKSKSVILMVTRTTVVFPNKVSRYSLKTIVIRLEKIKIWFSLICMSNNIGLVHG